MLASHEGELEDLHIVRCNRPNKCAYCAKRISLENAEMLVLDSQAVDARVPELYAVLTTDNATTDLTTFYRAREKTMRALRLKSRWPDAQYAALVEYTKGKTQRSQGRRYPHWNVLLKGVPAAELERAEEVIKRVWCEQTGASPRGQYVGPIDQGVEGLIRYVALHFQKEDQRPPEGFRGKRFIPSLGYWEGGKTAAQVRVEAKERLLYRMLLNKAQRDHELEGLDAAKWADEAYARHQELDWTVVALTRDRWGERIVQVLNGEPLAIDRPEPTHNHTGGQKWAQPAIPQISADGPESASRPTASSFS